MIVTTLVVGRRRCSAFFRYTRYGLAMRAAAFDQEAALAQGVNVGRVRPVVGDRRRRWPRSPGRCSPPARASTGSSGSSPSRRCRRSSSAAWTPARGGRSAGSRSAWSSRWSAPTSATLAPWLGDNFAQRLAVRPDAARAAGQALRPVRHAGGRAGMTQTDPSPRTGVRPGVPPQFYRPTPRTWRCSTPGPSAGVAAIAGRSRWLLPFLLDDPAATARDGVRARHRRDRAQHRDRLAGQVSLGHAFFLGVGAYTAAAISGDPDGPDDRLRDHRSCRCGCSPPGVVAGARRACSSRRWPPGCAGSTSRSSRSGWSSSASTSSASGATSPAAPASAATAPDPSCSATPSTRTATFFTARAEPLPADAGAAADLRACSPATWPAPRVGRAFAAVRDRDIAAEMMGVDLAAHKTAGVRHLLVLRRLRRRAALLDHRLLRPGSFNLLLSVQFIAMVLIGGAGTVSGTIMGALFIALLPTLTRELPTYFPFISAQRHRRPPTSSSSSRSSTGCSSSCSCSSSHAACSASGSGSATTGRAGRSATDDRNSHRRRSRQHKEHAGQ